MISINFMVVALGGGLGAVARYAVSLMLPSFDPGRGLPVATLTANALGCLVIGVLVAWLFVDGRLGGQWRLFLVVGVVGSFTTFSALSLETLQLFQAGRTTWAIGYALLSMIMLPLLCLAGWMIGRTLP